MLPILNALTNALQSDERLVIDGKLAKNKIVELALNLDPSLLKLLLSDDQLKGHFFQDVDGMLIFDKVAFQRFVNNKSFLPDSFTQFKNKIGLSVDSHYLNESNDVVLSWPYKDCVLEGGQTKEDQKRSEVFWNETLAPEQVDTLLAPKALQKFSKYSQDGEHADFNLEQNDNLIIKGNNLLALHSLSNQFKSKVKLITIDPPYNTNGDGFNYNDSFNHSTWLTFIKNRLNVAKDLLSDDGSIFIFCDDNEQAYLKVLCDEVFGNDNFVNTLIWQKKYSPQNDARWFSDNHDFILCYAKNKEIWRPNPLPRSEKQNKAYKNPDNDPRGEWKAVDFSRKALIAHTVYDITTPSGRIVSPPKGRSWLKRKEDFDELVADNRVWFGADGNNVPALKKFISEVKDGVTPLTIWTYEEVGHNQTAKQELMKILPDAEEIFPTPKPEKLMQRILHLGSEENDIVLDFFAGSGSTAATSMKMKRQFITIEQMSYIHDCTVPRLQKTVDGDQNGISKDVNWQGGGSFVYCELAELASQYSDRVEQAQTSEELISIWNELKESSNLSYKVDPKQFDKNISSFNELSFENQQRFLIEAIDKNQLYVNYSDIDDESNGISEQDKKFNQMFYGA
ncbi:TPA: DNA methyltransferase [Vibrio parahaemolyticus]